jgi:hypothetical protein
VPWVRFDDQKPINRKVRGLSDPAYRLNDEAIFWCARNLTDGFVPATDLPDVASARRPLKFVPELVVRALWHLSDEVCKSRHCPANPNRRPELADDGWLIHDYFEYQPTKTKVLKEREQNAERQRRYREAHQGLEPGSESNGLSNAVTDAVSSVPPSRPVHTGVALDTGHTGSQSVRAGARMREAVRYLTSDYGLTDDEASSVWAEVERRSGREIKHVIPYLHRMIDRGQLADIVSAVLDAAAPPEPVLYAVPDDEAPPPVEAPPVLPAGPVADVKSQAARAREQFPNLRRRPAR